jgi:hypothetical protein
VIKAWALCLVLVYPITGLRTMAQTQDSASAASSNKAPAAAKTPTGAEEKKPADGTKPKKIWTNDELGSLKGNVSVVGTDRPAESPSQSSQNGSGTAVDSRRGKIQRYRAEIAELRKKTDAADQRISQLKSFKADDGSPSGGINPNGRYNMVPVDEQVKQLEEKKKQWLASIDDLENQAKKEGIEPGELR